MSRFITLFILLLLCTSLIQSALLQHLSPWGIRPDLFIIFVIFFSFKFNAKQANLPIFIVGITKDVFSAGPLGLNAFLFIICGFLISLIKDRIFKEHPFTQAIITFIISVLYGTGYVSVLSLSSHSVSITGIGWRITAVALYTALIAPFAYLLLCRFRFSYLFERR
ncbi:MAG TPA: rod shape-determining protein MreD [Candidatus Brocadiia bacterium]|nr:rod shape-determining protein MreD [Planctomycetota bacterium]MDO8092366.1 rod shape-determining protein MreD [Candidatus Brocadiales bacterium]